MTAITAVKISHLEATEWDDMGLEFPKTSRELSLFDLSGIYKKLHSRFFIWSDSGSILWNNLSSGYLSKKLTVVSWCLQGIDSRITMYQNLQMLKSHSWPSFCASPHLCSQPTSYHVALYTLIENNSHISEPGNSNPSCSRVSCSCNFFSIFLPQ